MGDFWQHGPVTTLHRLPGVRKGLLEENLRKGARNRPLALLIPALASEMDGPAFPRIVEELGSVDYLAEVVIALGRASREDFARAKKAVNALPVRGTVLWPESGRLLAVFREAGGKLDIGPPGKGRDVWIALGYLLGKGGFHAFGLHDADIVTYSREIPLRLFSPLVHPDLSLAFCKGYYARVSESGLSGRVTRLLVGPLLFLLEKESSSPALRTMAAMRYALSGEFSLTADLAGRIPIPRDWGLEVGILSAVAAAVPLDRICQADLCENYDHKHQDLSPEDASRGLSRMAREVSANIIREAGFEGIPADLVRRYREKALSMIPSYRADALVNGLPYEEEKEKVAVEAFARALEAAVGMPGKGEMVEPLPPWKETEEKVPGLQDAIVEAVGRDNE